MDLSQAVRRRCGYIRRECSWKMLCSLYRNVDGLRQVYNGTVFLCCYETIGVCFFFNILFGTVVCICFHSYTVTLLHSNTLLEQCLAQLLYRECLKREYQQKYVRDNVFHSCKISSKRVQPFKCSIIKC